MQNPQNLNVAISQYCVWNNGVFKTKFQDQEDFKLGFSSKPILHHFKYHINVFIEVYT